MQLATGLIYVAKCLYTVDAVRQIVYTIRNKERSKIEVMNAIAQGFFSILQTGDIFARAFNVKNTSQYTWSILAATGDGVKSIFETVIQYKENGKDWKYLDVALIATKLSGMAMFRISDIVDAYQLPTSEKIEISFQVTGLCISLSGAVIQLKRKFPNIFKSVTKCCMKRKNPLSVQVLTPYRPLLSNSEAKLEIGIENKQDSNIENRSEQDQELLDAINTGRIENLNSIPEAFYDIPWTRCSISGKPIRFIVVPNIPSDEITEHMCYDKNELEKFFNKYPNQCPPYWPELARIHPLEGARYRADVREQRTIDLKLKKQLALMQERT